MNISTHYHRAMAAWRPLMLFTIMILAPALAPAQDLAQMFSNGAGGVGQVASVQVAQDQFVTAVINSTGNLEVIGWNTNFNTDQLTRQGTYYGPAAYAVQVSSPFALNAGVSGFFTTVAINSSNNLDISYWQLQPNGAISQIAETQGDTVSWDDAPIDLSIASVYYSSAGRPQFVSAIRNASGNLEVSLWYLDTRNHIRLSGTSTAGQVYGVSVAPMIDLNSDVVTAVENGSNDLELIEWYYNRFGSAITRGNTTYTSTATYGNQIATGVSYLNNPPNPVNAFYTAGVDHWNQYNTVSAWSQYMASQSQLLVSSNTVVALAGYGTAAIESVQDPVTSDLNTLYVYDQNSSNTFGQVASAEVSGLSVQSISLADTSSRNVIIFAVSGYDSNHNLQIQVWTYIRACSPWC